MLAQQILRLNDSDEVWPAAVRESLTSDVAAPPDAYQLALAIRRLQIARGNVPCGYKIGFTNRDQWPRYRLVAPIWGTVWAHGVANCDGVGELEVAGICQPRIEPEAVFGIAATPPLDATLDDVFECLDWVAPAFELAQSHCADWEFSAVESIADSAQHGRLLIGPRRPVRELADRADGFSEALAAIDVHLLRDGELVDDGVCLDVLDGPLHALRYLVRELQSCPGAPALKAGDVVSTGTWTDAWPVAAGQTWRAEFDAPLSSLELALR